MSQPAHEKIGVVDSQWIVHQVIPSLGSQVRRHYSIININNHIFNTLITYKFNKMDKKMACNMMVYVFDSGSSCEWEKWMARSKYIFTS